MRNKVKTAALLAVLFAAMTIVEQGGYFFARKLDSDLLRILTVAFGCVFTWSLDRFCLSRKFDLGKAGLIALTGPMLLLTAAFWNYEQNLPASITAFALVGMLLHKIGFTNRPLYPVGISTLR